MKKLLQALLLFTVIQTASAQSVNPQLSTMLQDTLNKYVTMITNIKGMSVSIYIPGQGIWKGSSGVSYSGQPITSDMEFGIASNTKLFVTTVILKLVENKILSLNDSLNKWLPAYKNINPKITIRQLLNHSSGISDPLFVAPYMDTIMKHPTRIFTPDEVLKWVGAPMFNPGTSWGYSNINYIIAGMIAENATGYHISKLIRDSILTPLNLNNSFYDVKETANGTVAHRWYNNVDYNDTSRVGLNTAGGCAGALFASTGDMVQWYHALFGGQILKPSSMAELTNFISTPAGYSYGLGLEKQTFFGHITWGHGGTTWGYKSRMVYDPCSGVAVCGLVNSWPAGNDGITVMLYKVLLDVLPACPEAISGQTTICQGQGSVTYTVPTISKATTYLWNLPAGASGSSVTNSITVNFGLTAISGNITVCGVNALGQGSASTIAITVNNKPQRPYVTKNINTLHSDAASGNQWYDSNGPISGAVNQNYTLTANGDYFDMVTLSGCSSDSSNIIHANLTGINENGINSITRLFPNPFNDELTVEADVQKSEFEIINTFGQVVYRGMVSGKTTLNTSTFAPGIYLLKLKKAETFEFKLIVRE